MNLKNIFKPRNLVSLSIPVGVILANLLLPLPTIVQQAMIGIVLIWFFIQLTAGFPLFSAGSPEENKSQEKDGMKKTRFVFTPELYTHSLYAVLIVAATTALMLLAGRETLGEAVVALLFLVPVAWSAARWGQAPGMSAALTAALMFNFFFIPPFYTFVVGSLQGWLVLAIFLIVALVVVGRIQAILSRAQTSEREAVLMYELSAILAQAPSQEAIANGVARFLQQRYLATLVTVAIQPKGQANEIAAYEPQDGGIVTGNKPDRVLALLDAWGLVGEIHIWKGQVELPPQDSRLLQNFAAQVGHVLARTYPEQSDAKFSAAAISNTK